MTDIVERLRDWSQQHNTSNADERVLREAADEIELLRMEVSVRGNVNEGLRETIRIQDVKLANRDKTIEAFNERSRAALPPVG